MYAHIMTPVDLSHPDRMQKAVRTAIDFAKVYDADVTLVGLTSPQPSAVAHNPEEFARKLEAYAGEVASLDGVTVKAHPIVDHDPSADIDRVLVRTASDLGADLVVMASHVPGRFGGPSHGGSLAAHADMSVLVVRGD